MPVPTRESSEILSKIFVLSDEERNWLFSQVTAAFKIDFGRNEPKKEQSCNEGFGGMDECDRYLIACACVVDLENLTFDPAAATRHFRKLCSHEKARQGQHFRGKLKLRGLISNPQGEWRIEVEGITKVEVLMVEEAAHTFSKLGQAESKHLKALVKKSSQLIRSN